MIPEHRVVQGAGPKRDLRPASNASGRIPVSFAGLCECIDDDICRSQSSERPRPKLFVYPRSTVQMDLMQYVAISQDGRILELQFAGQNAPHRNLLFPLRLQLTGALSEPFTADVTCLSQSSAIELKTLLGQRAGITTSSSRAWAMRC
ncbi:hypothetical protein ACQEPW_015260 [Xanthomonas oryzae pv. oryzicola]|uniref:hypothetical protein n=1 Tax=Xanthomonas oryzae TaxID=347 RepID=UPI003D1673B3